MRNITQGDTHFFVHKDDIEDLLVNLINFYKNLYDEDPIHIIDNKDTMESINKILSIYRWNVSFNKNYDICEIYLKDICCDVSYSTLLFKSIAPYVVDNCYISLMKRGKIVCMWSFKGKKCKRLTVRLAGAEDIPNPDDDDIPF